MKLSVFLLLFASIQVYAQETYFVQDELTLEAIPFVKITPDTGNSFLSDLDGAFEVPNNIKSLTLSYRGYIDTTVFLNTVENRTIFMSLNVQNVDEIVITPGVNPAHRIMKKAIENRKKNHPLKNNAFRYNSYSKFIFDLNPDAMSKISDTTTDSTLIGIKTFFDAQHLFMMESASKRTFIPPFRDQEEITAYKVSGFSDPRFSTFANSMQSFSFYDNQFDLLGSQYINPLAFGGINRYLFVLQDTTIQESDTTFTIYYRPKKGRSFNGMEGTLYINTNGFAVEKVVASPYQDKSGFQVKIVQQYQYIDGKKWFPSKLSTEIAFGETATIANIEDGYLVGTGYSYIEDIEIDPEDLHKRFNNNVSLYTADEANEQNDSTWNDLRKYEISSREESTYRVIDSISEVQKFDKKLELLNHLLEGKIPLGNYNIIMARLLNFDIYEGYRFGLGLETSKKVMKNLYFGGYAALSNRDKEWKYGGYSRIHLNKKRGIRFDLKYQQDVAERGGFSFENKSFSLNDTELMRHFFITNMDRQRLGEISFAADIKANMNLRIVGNYQRIQYTDDYNFSPLDSTLYRDDNETDLAETGIEFTWNILEKYVLLGDMKLSQGRKYPSIKIKVVKGWKDWFESNYDYWRFNAEISQDFSFIGIGKLSLKAKYNKTFGAVPLFLAHEGNGTGKNWNLSVMNTFEAMAPSEFYSTEQFSLYARFGIQTFKTKANWNEPKISFHHALGFGSFKNQQEHSVEFRTMDRGYYEAGLILDGIFTSTFASIGLGGFYRYGDYADEDWTKNIVPKISIAFKLN